MKALSENVNRKELKEERIAICSKFGCKIIKKVKPLKLGFIEFNKYPKCSKHKVPLVFIDEFIGTFVEAVSACLFDISSLPPDSLRDIVSKNVPDEFSLFINNWMYCSPIGRGAHIVSRYLDGLSRGYIKLFSRKQKKAMDKKDCSKYLLLRTGLNIISEQYIKFLDVLRENGDLSDKSKLTSLSINLKRNVKKWLDQQLKSIKEFKIDEKNFQNKDLSLLKEIYDKILNANTCSLLLGNKLKPKISSFELFSAYFEFLQEKLCCKINKKEFENFLKYSNENNILMIQEKENLPNQRRTFNLNRHQKDIEDIILKKNGNIIDSKWKYIGKDNRKTPYFLIRCNRDCIYDCDDKREFWINKYELKPSKRHPEGKWCPYRIITKSLNRHQMDIEDIVRKREGNIIDSEWKYIGKNKYKKPYYLIECGGDNENNEKHQWWVVKSKIISGAWCPKCPKGKSLEEHKLDIENIVKNKRGKIIGMEWRYDEKNHPKGVWCRECQYKSLEQHQYDIEEYVEQMGGKILKNRWKYMIQGKYKAKIPYFYIECNNKKEKHKWWVAKGNLIPKPSNPTGSWCMICSDRIRAIGEYSHIIIEYWCLKYLALKKCNARHEYILDEGSRPDLIINRDDNFKSNIEPHQSIISFVKNIKEIAIDFTMSLIPSNILRKCFKNYQNKDRYLLIVLIREEGCVNTQYIQDLIDNDEDIDNREKKLIIVINFDEFLRFLSLDINFDLLNFKIWGSLSEEVREIISMLQKTIKLSIDAIGSSSALGELIKLKEKCKKFLEIENHNK